MNNGVNDTTNQTIPGVKVAMPSDKPVDASTTDVGAAVSKAQVAATAQAVSAMPNVSDTGSTAISQTTQTASLLQAPVANTTVQVSPVQQPVSQVIQPASVLEPDSAASGNGAEKKKKVKKQKNKLARFFFFIIVLLIGASAYLWYYHEQQMAIMRVKCTPVSTTGETKELALDSTIVKELYSKVSTTLREDLGQSELNDELKIYLAFRQIPNSMFYESHCGKFQLAGIEPFTCVESAVFTPRAFKAETIQLEIKKLFGEDVNIANQNVQLGNSCMGGFQYIEERGEYVEGQCQTAGATMFRAEKELIGATSTESTIVLREKVKYYGSEGLELPSRLVSGTYEYTFKLDMNYNYIYVSKNLVE